MDLHRIDLNLLVSLDALLAEQSVTRAAHRLSIGQSAMSSTLGRLRRLFDDPLLVRVGRGLEITPFAQSLADPLRDALIQVHGVFSAGSQFDPSSDHRSFTVMSSDYAVLAFLHPLLLRLRAEAPNIRLQLRATSAVFEQELRRHEVDALVTPREAFPNHVQYSHQLLFRDDWVCAVAADHPEVGSRMTVEQFSRLPYLATTTGSLPSYVEQQLDLLGIERRTEVTAGLGIAPFILPGSNLVTLMPRRLADLLGAMAWIRVLEPPMRLSPLHEVLVWNSRYDSDPGHRWLRQQLSELAEQPVAPRFGTSIGGIDGIDPSNG